MRKYLIIFSLSLLAVTAYGCSKHKAVNNGVNRTTQQAKEKCKTMYKSTMMPKEISTTPGKDSMGMEMVPFQVCEQTEQEKPLAAGTVQISSRLQQMYGVALGLVENRKLTISMRNDAIIKYDETKLKDINIRFSGYIQKLYADYTGMMVYKGQRLFTIYSPELVSAEQEYLLVISNPYSANNKELVRAAEEKLRLWNITDRQIEEIKKAGKPFDTLSFHAPFTGYIIEKHIVQGQHVDAGQTLFRIADLSDVWAMVDVYEDQIPFVHIGQRVSLEIQSFSGEPIKGKIDYIYPYLDNDTRTVKARVVIPNPGYKIKPGMYGYATIEDTIGKRLSVPADAVMNTGTRQLVFVYMGNGYFEPRTVKLGEHTDKYYVVLSGLEAGDKVVTNPVFLIDAESNLNEVSGAMGSMPGMDMGNQKEFQNPTVSDKEQKQNTAPPEKKQKQQTSPPEQDNSMPGMKM
jgi:multidrug efflux pump subunit AcrA (membrane-fusion protein)